VERGRPGDLYAVKRLLPTLAEDPELVRLFLDEARVGAQLDHPGLVRVHELGKLGAVYFIAMDHVAGRDLRALQERLRRRGERLPVELAAHLALRAAEALDHAHRACGADGRPLRVVHRDVSPGNLLVGLDGAVRLIDFGIAQAAPRADAPALRGKVAYLSPELVRGLPVDRRSDVFSLGVVLHELLSGERLFAQGSEQAALERVRAAEAPPPSRLNPAVPPELDRVVLRALAREPEARFAWASELGDALAPWAPGAEGEPLLAALVGRLFPEAAREEEELRLRAAAASRAG
jgi:serine/threonine-protein kinase